MAGQLSVMLANRLPEIARLAGSGTLGTSTDARTR